MDTAWILIGSYLTPRERIILSRLSRKLHSVFSSHTDSPHWLTSFWKEMEDTSETYISCGEGVLIEVHAFHSEKNTIFEATNKTLYIKNLQQTHVFTNKIINLIGPIMYSFSITYKREINKI